MLGEFPKHPKKTKKQLLNNNEINFLIFYSFWYQFFGSCCPTVVNKKNYFELPSDRTFLSVIPILRACYKGHLIFQFFEVQPRNIPKA